MVLTVSQAETTSLDLPDTTAEILTQQAARIDADAVLRVIDSLAAAEGRLRYALSKRIFFEIALVRAIKAREAVGIDGILKKLNELKAGGATATVSHPSPPSPVPAASKPGRQASAKPSSSSSAPAKAKETTSPKATAVAVEESPSGDLDQAWAAAVSHLGKVAPLAKTYLVGTRPLGIKGTVITIGFDPEFAERREFVDTGKNRELLQGKLREQLHREVTLKFEVSDEVSVGAGTVEPASATSSKQAAPRRAAAGSDEFRDDPLIKQALEVFKGTIVEVRK